jgi:hypothetical protein
MENGVLFRELGMVALTGCGEAGGEEWWVSPILWSLHCSFSLHTASLLLLLFALLRLLLLLLLLMLLLLLQRLLPLLLPLSVLPVLSVELLLLLV